MVMLFGALSFALTQGFRGGSSSLTREQARIGASEILDYGQSVRDGVKALRISGIALRDVSFEMTTARLTDGTPIAYENNYCTDDRCKVFKPSGGNIKEAQFYHLAVKPTWWQDSWDKPGSSFMEMFDINGIGTPLSDLVLKVQRVKPDICKAINKLAGLNEEIYHEDQTGNASHVYAWNTQDALDATNSLQYGYATSALASKTFFCIGDPPNPQDGGDVIFLLQAR